MAVTKVSLSLYKDLVEQARTLAGSRGLSALVNEALRVQLQHELAEQNGIPPTGG